MSLSLLHCGDAVAAPTDTIGHPRFMVKGQAAVPGGLPLFTVEYCTLAVPADGGYNRVSQSHPHASQETAIGRTITW